MQGSLLAFFHLCLVSALFSSPSLTEMKFYRTFFPLVCVLFRGFLNQLGAGDEKVWRQCMMNTLVLEKNALQTRVRTPPHTHSQLPATFKQNLSRDDLYIVYVFSSLCSPLLHANQASFTLVLMYMCDHIEGFIFPVPKQAIANHL